MARRGERDEGGTTMQIVDARSTAALTRQRRRFSPRLVALVAYGLGTGVALAASVALPMLGLTASRPLTLTDIGLIASHQPVALAPLVTYLLCTAAGIAVEAAWIAPRGQHAVLAPLIATILTWAISGSLAPFGVPEGVVLVASAVFWVLLVSSLIGRRADTW